MQILRHDPIIFYKLNIPFLHHPDQDVSHSHLSKYKPHMSEGNIYCEGKG